MTPLASLPRLMETTPSTVPDNIPYLFAERAAAKAMAEELAAHGGRSALAVGLRWLDDRQHGLLGKNACPFTALKPILAVKDASFHSLQRGRPDKRLPKSIHNLARRLERFDDTAAALQALDLVITTDGAMAHLAGAMGRPVWLLLPKVPDGLWPLQGETTPWYPTMRLYRQEKAGDWQAPVARIARDLAALAKDGKSR